MQAICKLTIVKKVAKILQIIPIIKSINILFALIILLEHLKCLSVLFVGQGTHISWNIIALAYKTPRWRSCIQLTLVSHLTSGLSRSLKKLADSIFQLNRVQYLSKGLNLLVILKIHKDYYQQNATHPCVHGVAVRGFEDTDADHQSDFAKADSSSIR